MDLNVECPICSLTDVMDLGSGRVECVTCGHEWERDDADGDEEREVRDANGNLLRSGDTVILAKDLKLKGTTSTIKVGTKISNIRIVAGDHEIDCKVDGRPVLLKGQFLRKA